MVKRRREETITVWGHAAYKIQELYSEILKALGDVMGILSVKRGYFTGTHGETSEGILLISKCYKSHGESIY